MTPTATILLLGSGELGREFAISAKRLGCRVIACDSYADAPAMQVADAAEVFSMLDGAALRAAIERHRPDHIVPEVEAIRTACPVSISAGSCGETNRSSPRSGACTFASTRPTAPRSFSSSRTSAAPRAAG